MTASAKAYPVRDAFRRFLPDYESSHMLTPQQAKTASCIFRCKTGDLGYNVSVCTNPDCRHVEIHAVSCNNRHCPCCQAPAEQKWIYARNSELIEGIAYYHAIFTVPYELNDLIYANQKALYGIMFRCAADTLLTLCRDPKHLGATPGIVAVLHTHGQKLNFHPHIHTILSGGGITKAGQFIEAPHRGYLLPQEAMGRLFRGKFMDALTALHDENGLTFTGPCEKLRNSYEWNELVDRLYKKAWIPEIKETFNGNGNAVHYLARYVFRSAISNSRIESVDEDGVSFHYKDYRDGSKQKTMTMSGEEFIDAFLRHVLPSGFQRVRFYGFLANSVRNKRLRLIHKLRNSVYKGNPVKDLSMPDLMMKLYGVEIGVCPCCRSPAEYHRIQPLQIHLFMRTLTT